MLKDLLGKEVVVDTDTSYVYIGVLCEVTDDCLVMERVDVHDGNDLEMSKEKYILESRMYGVKENRKKVYIVRRRVVSFSLLEDVLKF